MGWGSWSFLAVVFLLAMLGNVLLELIPTGSGGIAPIRVIMRFVASAAPMGIALYSLSLAARRAQAAESREEKRRKEADTERRETIRFRMLNELSATLEATVSRLFPGEAQSNIRANVMLIRNRRLRPVCSWNMRAYPDRELEFQKGQGICGVVWKLVAEGNVNKLWTPRYASIKKMPRSTLKDRYGLTPDQLAKTKHILWILSVPLFSQKDDSLSFIGVLNLDGVNALLKEPGRLTVDNWDNVTGAAKNIVQELERLGTVAEGGEVDPVRPLW